MVKLFFMVMMTLFAVLANAGNIVVLGDSISASYGIDVDRGWVKLLQKKLEKENLAYVIHNESISGDTSAGGLARIDKALASYQPDVLLLELGANDGLRGLSPKTMRNNLAEIIRRSKQAGAQVLLLGMRIPPNYGKRYIEMFHHVYLELSDDLAVPLVPFILEDVALNQAMMQTDGLHPNAKAQPIIASKIWKYLYPLLNSE